MPIVAPVVEGTQTGVTGTNTTSHVLTFPSGTVAGELIVAWLVLDSQQIVSSRSNPNLVWPDGWHFLDQPWASSAPGAKKPKYGVYWKIAEVSETSVTVTSDEAQKSGYVTVRVSGFRQGGQPIIWVMNTSEALTGATEPVLVLAFQGWRNGTITASVAAPFAGLQQINDTDATEGVGVAFASASVSTPRMPDSVWSFSATGTDGAGQPLPYAANPWDFAVLPLCVDDEAPLDVTSVYTQTWPVLKSASGAFSESTYGRPPYDSDAVDPDYPEIVASESTQVALDGVGRHVLTGDWSSGNEDDWISSGLVLYEIGSEGATPGDPGAGVSEPVGGWFNAREGRWSVDHQLIPVLWSSDVGYGLFSLLTGWLTSTLQVDWYAFPSQAASYGYGPSKYGDLSLSYTVLDPEDWDAINLSSITVDGFDMPREQWEGARVRFLLEWRCGTVTYDPPGSTYATSIDIAGVASDGFLRLTITDLDTSVETVAYNLQGIPLLIESYQGSGEPGINYACGMSLGYSSQLGPCEGTEVQAVIPDPPFTGGGMQTLNSPQVCFPSAADGVSVTTNATAWANSAWVTVIASTASAMIVTGLVVEAASAGFEVDVGVGAAGSEVVKTTFRGNMPGGFSSPGSDVIHHIIPLDAIPASSRVAIRARKSTAGGTIWRFSLLCVAKPYAGILEVSATPQKCLPSAASDQALAANPGVAWTNSAYTQLIASTPAAWVLTGIISPSVNTGGTAHEIDIAVGAAGSEVVKTTIRVDMSGSGGGSGGPKFIPLWNPLDVFPTGSRIAARYRHAGTSGVPAIALVYREKPL